MRFEKVRVDGREDRNHVQSACGRYTVTRVSVARERVFQAWAGRVLLRTARGADAERECKAACEAHAKE